MELLQNYKGCVFFIDILGMSALTNGKIGLKKEDFIPWLGNEKKRYSNQFLGAAILAEFRRILMELDYKYKNVTITQLSDCAFIWSQNIADVIVFASQFMHLATNNGILCRGGISYGEIIETSQSHKLGRFIVGDAVTSAAKLESKSKGCRILINQNVPHTLWEQDKNMSDKIHQMFLPFINPVDYSVFDEFKWYLTPALELDNLIDIKLLSFEEKVKLTKQRLCLGNLVRCSPKFNWNSKSSEGLQQLIPSINFLTENNLLEILHNFGWENVIDHRDDETVVRINSKINEYNDFRKIKVYNFPNDWDE